MSREVQVRFCESRAVRFRPATHRILLVRGDRAHAEALREEAAAVLAPMGLRLSGEKTKITHIDEGLDFLGWRISVTGNEARPRASFTPTRARRPSARSWARCERSAG
jgi:hypothetical protein